MSQCNMKDRLRHLRTLREKLCDQQEEWKAGFEVRDWIVKEIIDIRSMILNPDHDHDAIVSRLNNILSMFGNSEEKCNGG